jgi:hypothetical protein
MKRSGRTLVSLPRSRLGHPHPCGCADNLLGRRSCWSARWTKVAQLGALLAANGRRRPVTYSHIRALITWSDGTPSLVWHHTATLCDRLTVKHVHWEPVVGLAGPRGIGGTTITGQVVAVITGTWQPEPITPARPTVAGLAVLVCPARSWFRRRQAPDGRKPEPGWTCHVPARAECLGHGSPRRGAGHAAAGRLSGSSMPLSWQGTSHET